MSTAPSKERVVCFCKRPAKECVVTKPGIADTGRHYYICADEECDFHRWADEAPKRKKDKPQDPNIIGTAFTDEDKEEKTLPLWEQTVTDEKGRKRFHGAFTGGFSAGYWNTVGSAEGWEPANFKSSREKRASVKQDVRSFMDEEDVKDELMGGDAIRAKAKFSAFGSTADEINTRQSSTLFSAMNELIVPAKDPIGKKLLRLMGWREGHGVGSNRVKLQKKPNTSTRVIGPQIPPEIMSNLPPVEHEEIVMVPPKNTTTVEYLPKNDTYGIGFDPYTSAPGTLPQTPLSPSPNPSPQEFRNEGGPNGESSKNKRMMTTKSFGLGALEDADDEEVYDNETMDMYDRTLGTTEQDLQPPSTSIPSSTSSTSSSSSIQKPSPLVMDSKRCSDGSLPLKGFRVGGSIIQNIWFQPPKLPSDWKPPIRNNSITATEASYGGFTTITPQQRGALLGEKQLPSGITPSVFQLLSMEDQSKLASLTGRFSSGTIETFNPEPQTIEWMKAQEKKAFEETAAKFKPLSDAMASRFTKSTEVVGEPKKKDQEEEGQYKVESYQSTAAEMQMFGKLTRSVEDWFPCGLLCKRFNLKNPHSGGKKKPEKKQTSDLLSSVELPIGTQPSDIVQKEDLEMGPVNQDGVEETKEEEEEEENVERPSIDFFKSIFEGEEDEEEEQKQEEEKKEEKVEIQVESSISKEKPITHETLSHKSTPVVEELSNKEPQSQEPNPYLYYPPKQDSRGGVLLEKEDNPRESTSSRKEEKQREDRHDRSKDRDRHRTKDKEREREDRHKDERHNKRSDRHGSGRDDRNRDRKRSEERDHSHHHKRSRRD